MLVRLMKIGYAVVKGTSAPGEKLGCPDLDCGQPKKVPLKGGLVFTYGALENTRFPLKTHVFRVLSELF
jgi:hypothetical protein